jgi:hypothetical protein
MHRSLFISKPIKNPEIDWAGSPQIPPDLPFSKEGVSPLRQRGVKKDLRLAENADSPFFQES